MIPSELLTVDKSRKEMYCEASDLLGHCDFPRECIKVKSHVTGNVMTFYTYPEGVIWDEGHEDILGWRYTSFYLPGWTLTIFND